MYRSIQIGQRLFIAVMRMESTIEGMPFFTRHPMDLGTLKMITIIRGRWCIDINWF